VDRLRICNPHNSIAAAGQPGLALDVASRDDIKLVHATVNFHDQS
jgi:hypothetical protein